jgi:hypothetical protein
MSYILFIDDRRNPTDMQFSDHPEIIKWKKKEIELKLCRSNHEAYKAVQEFGVPSFIMFDHDLGEGYNHKLQTVKDFVHWFFNRYKPELSQLPNYSVHYQPHK